MKYEIEWAAMGSVTIDTEGTSWSPEEVQMQADQVVCDWADALAEKMAEEFEDCDVQSDEAGYECKPRRLS